MILAVKGTSWRLQIFLTRGWPERALQGQHGAGGKVFFGGGVGLEALFVGDGVGFEGPEAELTPAADGHGFDEVEFVGGFVAANSRGEVGEELEEALAGFAGEQDGVGEETVDVRLREEFVCLPG